MRGQIGAAYGPGCLGQNVDACLAKLRPYTSPLRYSFAMDAIERNKRTDVNGKKLYTENMVQLMLNDAEPYEVSHLTIVINYSDTNEITKVDVILRGSADSAMTDEDYAKTGLYDGAVLAIGKRCDTLASPRVFHKFFHNVVKPKMQPTGHTSDVDAIKWVDLCGVKISYSETFWHDTHDIRAYNPTGISALYMLQFK